MASPKLLLSDEPETGLNIDDREALLEALNAIVGDRPSMVLFWAPTILRSCPRPPRMQFLRAGQVVAAGPIDGTITLGSLSACFNRELHVHRGYGRWTARSQQLSE